MSKKFPAGAPIDSVMNAVKNYGEFSVYQYFEDGTYECVRKFVNAQEAAKAVGHYTTSAAVRLGVVVRVIVTDGGDCICWEWTEKEGIVFPPKSEPKKDTE